MNSAGFPPFPPLMEIALVVLAEFVFGLGYNTLVALAGRRYPAAYRLMVSLSVALGVATTLVLPAVFWWGRTQATWQWAAIFLLCFAGSGLPMIGGSLKRNMAGDSHRRREWPTAARRARDEAVMELSALAEEVHEKARTDDLKATTLISLVHRLHQVIGTLKSV